MTNRPPVSGEPSRHPVRIKVYGGMLNLLPAGTDWRVTETSQHYAPHGLIGEAIPEWSIIDLSPADTVPPAEGDIQRRCWTIYGPEPISQCVLFNGHDGDHDFGGTHHRQAGELGHEDFGEPFHEAICSRCGLMLAYLVRDQVECRDHD